MSEDADAIEQSIKDEVKRVKIDVFTECLELAHQDEGPSSSIYNRIKDRLEDAKAGRDDAFVSVVAGLEERFAENPEDEVLRRDLHLARVRAGWLEFRVRTASGVDPRTIIPWVAVLEVLASVEEWRGKGAPPQAWLKPDAKPVEGGRLRVVGNHRICKDDKWRRDVREQVDVVAVESLANLCSVVQRMEDVTVHKAEFEGGLMTLTIVDARDP